MGGSIRDAQPSHRRQPRDWTLVLLGVFVMALVAGTMVVRLFPLNAPYYSEELFRLGIGASLGLMGVAFGAAGILIRRRSPRVRLLIGLARDPQAVGILYMGMALGYLASGIAQAISAVPGETALYISLSVFGIVPGLLLCAYYIARYIGRRRRHGGELGR